MRQLYIALGPPSEDGKHVILDVEDKNGASVGLNPIPDVDILEVGEYREPRPERWFVGPFAVVHLTQQLKPKSCYNCKHHNLCFMRRELDALIQGSCGYMNVVGIENEGSFQDLFIAMAGTCSKYEEAPE